MRASQGLPMGRKVVPYHPEMFQEYEEVIIYPRKEFKRNFMHIKDSLNYIFNKYYMFDLEKDWQIYGLWLNLYERVQIIDTEMHEFVNTKDSQAFLDTYLCEDIPLIENEILGSQKIEVDLLSDLNWP